MEVIQEKETTLPNSVFDILNDYVSDAASERVAPSFVDGVAYRGENPPSPFVVAYGDRWKMDGEDEVPEGYLQGFGFFGEGD